MELLRVGVGKYVVLITEQVLTELADWSSAKDQKNAMLSLLADTVPAYGPQEDNPNICIPLKGTDGLLEFRKNAKRGTKVRVLWFYGDPTCVVCVRAFVKTFPHTPPDEIAAASDEKRLYFDALAHRSLKIEEALHLVRRKSR